MNAIKRGMLDFRKGSLSNPYNEGTQRNKDWEFGFNKAYFANLEKVKENESRRRGKEV